MNVKKGEGSIFCTALGAGISTSVTTTIMSKQRYSQCTLKKKNGCAPSSTFLSNTHSQLRILKKQLECLVNVLITSYCPMYSFFFCVCWWQNNKGAQRFQSHSYSLFFSTLIMESFLKRNYQTTTIQGLVDTMELLLQAFFLAKFLLKSSERNSCFIKELKSVDFEKLDI